MKSAHRLTYALILGCLALLASCGDKNYSASGGIGGTGIISTGEVTEFGSVWVNGVRFDTRKSDIYIGDTFVGTGDPTVLEHLYLGKIVRVNGRLDTDGSGRAEKVSYLPLLFGPIEESDPIDDYTRQLTVLGQHVIIDQRTWLKDADIDALDLGHLVEVSGYFNDAGDIQATFIQRVSMDAPPETVFILTGPVSNSDPLAHAFYINPQRVDVSDLDAAATAVIENDQVVTVAGRLDAGSGDFIVLTIAAYRLLGDIDTKYIEIEGIIQAGLLDNQFTMGGYLFQVTENTELINGTPDDLLPGAKVEVEGDYSAPAVAASKIKFKQLFKTESKVATINGAEQTLTLIGMAGLTVQANPQTRYLGQLHSDDFEQLAPGVHVVIKGWPIDDEHILATSILGLPETQDKALLCAMVQEIDDERLTLNGVVIDTSNIPAEGFFLDDEVSVSSEDFFNTVAQGQWVTVSGNLKVDETVAWYTINLTNTGT